MAKPGADEAIHAVVSAVTAAATFLEQVCAQTVAGGFSGTGTENARVTAAAAVLEHAPPLLAELRQIAEPTQKPARGTGSSAARTPHPAKEER